MARAFTHNKATILIIEKDVRTAYLLDYLLSREGYNVVSTTNSEVAVQLLQKMAPADIIFMDVTLSCDNNYDILNTIRNLPAWHAVPVLLLTEQYSMESVNGALDAGATDYIMQPFDHSELLTHIQRHAAKQMN